MFVLPALASGLAKAFSLLLKHPFVTKMLLFTFFIGIVSYSITYMRDLVAPYISSNELLSVASYFGILDGLSLYITILVSGFGVKQIIAFIRV